ncbi:hypothetical protein ACRAWB_18235 [Leifsonia poae]|uniref:hypothetical protein n=1 Tax=Leifsonia poae TaxID=110933 RepID=UPI003D69B537
MAAKGDARLIFELGEYTRFVAHVPLRGEVTAAKAIELLTPAADALRVSLQRSAAREALNKEDAAGVEAGGI